MKRLLLVFLLVVVAGAGASGQQHEQPYTVLVNVDLVLLNVRVTNHGGRSVTGLDATNFRVYEDRHLQEIAFFSGQDAPATVGLVVDSSASMAPKWSDVQTAVALFAQQSNPRDEMFMIHFSQDLHWPLPEGKSFTSEVRDLQSSMAAVVPQGKTALYDAISAALERVKEGSFEKRILVVLSDGSDNASLVSLSSVLILLQRANVTVFTVGLYDSDAWDRNPGVLKRLAAVTGGEVFFPEDVKELQEAWNHIAGAVRNEYTLGYYPQISPDGNYHQLTVGVAADSNRRMSVRTRPGYFAAAKQVKSSR